MASAIPATRPPEHCVPGGVPVGVVDRLEEVEVDDDQRERLAKAPGAVLLLGQDPVVLAPVEEARQLVAGREAAQRLQGVAELERVAQGPLERARR
jgi:hypothetical protein